MIADDTREIFVGLAAVIAFIAVAALILGGADRTGVDDDRLYRITATFNRVDGVAPGTPVQVGGILVGTVDHLELTADFRVRITMGIDRTIPLPADSSISVQTDGLFGPKSMRIEPGGEETVLTDGGHIDYAQDPLMVSDLLDLIIAEGKATRTPPAEAR